AATSAGVLGYPPAADKTSEPSPPAPVQAQPSGYIPVDLYQDITERSGVHFTYRNGEEAGNYAILESLGGGVALIDYDGDGLPDLFITGGGSFDGNETKGQPTT